MAVREAKCTTTKRRETTLATGNFVTIDLATSTVDVKLPRLREMVHLDYSRKAKPIDYFLPLYCSSMLVKEANSTDAAYERAVAHLDAQRYTLTRLLLHVFPRHTQLK